MKNILLKSALLFALTTHMSFAFPPFNPNRKPQQCKIDGIEKFKQALAKHDKNTIANFIAYPLRVNTGPSQYYSVQNKKEFLAKYDSIFNDEVVKDIKHGLPPSCQPQGAMLGSGSVWFKTNSHPAKISAINTKLSFMPISKVQKKAQTES